MARTPMPADEPEVVAVEPPAAAAAGHKAQSGRRRSGGRRSLGGGRRRTFGTPSTPGIDRPKTLEVGGGCVGSVGCRACGEWPTLVTIRSLPPQPTEPPPHQEQAALKDMYSKVIQMSSENKITSKNAWYARPPAHPPARPLPPPPPPPRSPTTATSRSKDGGDGVVGSGDAQSSRDDGNESLVSTEWSLPVPARRSPPTTTTPGRSK